MDLDQEDIGILFSTLLNVGYQVFLRFVCLLLGSGKGNCGGIKATIITNGYQYAPLHLPTLSRLDFGMAVT